MHDLSRVQVNTPEEYARLNMPFELGIDYGVSLSQEPVVQKYLLVIAQDRYLYQAALSDIAGWDIRFHGGDFEEAIRGLRVWLGSHGLADRSGSQIIGDYIGFQEWDFERLLADGWSEKDIRDRETKELLDAMSEWRRAERPATFS